MVGLSLPFFRRESEKSVVVAAEGEEVFVEPLPENVEILDEYWVREKYARVVIARAPESSTITYYVDEVKLNPDERSAYLKISDIIARELNPAEIGKEEDVRKELLREARRLSMKYERAFKTVTRAGWDKINYYLERDLLGFGPLNVIISDYRVEDISCDGVNVPIFVWHRRYESIPTNIKFLDKDALDDYIVKLAHKSGKHVSSAFPIVDAMLFGKHRLAASFRDEVSPKGSTFTIRKFREEPFSIVDLVQMGTISDEMAAYFWMLIENRATIMVIGGTGSGKTTILNALASLIKPGMKIVTVEETAELNLPHENWVQFVSRESYGLTGTKVGQISLFDLVKTSLRYRPDYLIVGEVRGEEAYVLFQAMASVSGDTPILVKKDNEVRLVRIDEFVDRYYLQGEERVAKPVDGVYTLSIEGDRVAFKPIKYVLRHSCPEVYRIKYVGGEVRATGSHSVFVFDEEAFEIREKKVSSLREGELLVSYNSLASLGNGSPAYDLIDLFKSDDSILVTNIPQTVKEKAGLKHNPVPVKEYVKIWSESSGFENVKNVSLTKGCDGKAVPATVELDEDLGFVLGLYLAYGRVKEGGKLVFCLSKGGREKILDRLVEAIERKFNDRPFIEDRKTCLLVEYNNSILAEFFEKTCGRIDGEKHVPSKIWKASYETVLAFLEGLKADASRRSRERRQVTIAQKNLTLLQELAWLFRMSGFDTRISMEGGGCGKLTLISRRGNALGEGVPIAALRKLYSMLKPASTPHEYSYLLSGKCKQRFCDRGKAKEVLNWIWINRGVEPGKDAERLYGRLLSFLEGEITLLPVRKVSKEAYSGYVYDLSVPESEAFFGGNNPILLHNTGHGGLSTLHAETIEYAIRRLVSPPMNVSETYIPLINAVILVERVTLPQPRMGMSIGRRARMVWEVEDFEKYVNIFSWVPQDDIFLSRARDSLILMRIAERLGKSRRWIVNELERRKIVIRWMADKGIHNVKDVARIVYQYYSNPDLLMSKIEEEAVIKKEEIQPIFTAPTLTTAPAAAATTETQTPVRMIEESLMKIYSILSTKGGTASLEVLAKESGMDDVSLWRYLNILKGFGHVQTVEKKEGDRYTTFFTLTDRGVSAFETLRSRLSQK